MKTKTLFVAAVAAALAAVSCQRTDLVDNVLDEGTPINVVLKIGGVEAAQSRALQEDPGSSVTPELSDGVVFFYDESSGTIWGNEAIEVSEITAGDGQIFEQISSKADMIYIVGNIPSSELSSLKANTTITDLKSELLSLSNQSSVEPTAVLLANTYMDSKEEYDAVIKLDDEGEDYIAKVLLAPSLSRLQFTDITTEDSRITSYEVAGVYVDNYHESYVPSTDDYITTDPLTVGQDGSLLGTLTSQPYDVPSSAVSSTSGSVSASDFDADSEIFGYNLTPTSSASGDGEYTPALIVKLTNIVYTDTAGETQTMETGYITVARYSDEDGEITAFESGTLYNIPSGSFVFDLSNITDDPNQPDVEVTVFAEVCPWVISTVTPYL
ncbi:MAG: hypothetical protein R3Y61_03855 [Rikenellaceae bacterium]